MGGNHYPKPPGRLESSYRSCLPWRRTLLRNGKMKLLTVLASVIGLLAPLAAAGCASGEGEAATALDYTDNARQEYEAALEAFEDKNWELADELLNEVKRKYAYSRYARLAELRLADANFQQEKF